jgi:hypothetical protein
VLVLSIFPGREEGQYIYRRRRENKMAITEAGKRELFAKHMNEEMGLTVDETVGGLALVVLGILALRQIDPSLLNSIAVIVAGVSLAFMSMTLSSDLARALSASGQKLNTSELVGSVNAGVLVGASGVVLGILAVLDVSRAVLNSVALIAFGAAVLFDFAARAEARALRMMTDETPEQSARLALSAATNANTAALFVGVGLVTLGILALTGLSSAILVSVALLGLGAYLLLEGTSVVGYMVSWATS